MPRRSLGENTASARLAEGEEPGSYPLQGCQRTVRLSEDGKLLDQAAPKIVAKKQNTTEFQLY
jgi:hypothetical protein